MIAAIGAVANQRVLGLANWLPWDIPEELGYFEKTTEGAALVAGRTTYESMDVVPEDMFVLTRQQSSVLRPGCYPVTSVEAAILRAAATGKPVFVIGGASVYEAAWPYCEYFYLTHIDLNCSGDTYFPATIPFEHWEVVNERSEVMRDRVSDQLVTCRFVIYRQSDYRQLVAEGVSGAPTL